MCQLFLPPGENKVARGDKLTESSGPGLGNLKLGSSAAESVGARSKSKLLLDLLYKHKISNIKRYALCRG